MDQEQDDFADFRKSLAGLGGAERKAQLKAMEDAILENWRTQVVPDLYVDDEPVAEVVTPEAKPAPAPAPMPQQQPVKTAPPQPFKSVIDDEAEPVDPATLMMAAGPAGAPAAKAMQAQRGTPPGTYKPPFGREGDAEGERPDWTQDYPFTLEEDDGGETDRWFEEKYGDASPETIQQAIADLSADVQDSKDRGTYGGDGSMIMQDVLNRLQAKAGAATPKRKMSMMGPAR